MVMLVFICFFLAAALSFNKQPLNPTIVVVGHNSSRITLGWEYTASVGEKIVVMRIQRLNDSNSQGVTLASGVGSPSQGKVVDDFNKDGHFGFKDPATLVINQVTAKDEFVYRCEVLTASNPDGHKNDINLRVYSKFYDIHNGRHLLDFLTVLLDPLYWVKIKCIVFIYFFSKENSFDSKIFCSFTGPTFSRKSCSTQHLICVHSWGVIIKIISYLV